LHVPVCDTTINICKRFVHIVIVVIIGVVSV
jgi:hypothetical protein